MKGVANRKVRTINKALSSMIQPNIITKPNKSIYVGSREEEKVGGHKEEEGGGMMDLAPHGTVSSTGELELRALFKQL